MATCPTCKKPNCGNHAACARRPASDAEQRQRQRICAMGVELAAMLRAESAAITGDGGTGDLLAYLIASEALSIIARQLPANVLSDARADGWK